MSNMQKPKLRTFFWTKQVIEEHGLEELVRLNLTAQWHRVIMQSPVNSTDVKVIVEYI